MKVINYSLTSIKFWRENFFRINSETTTQFLCRFSYNPELDLISCLVPI